jgi:rhodanese-related sulfurtransferase
MGLNGDVQFRREPSVTVDQVTSTTRLLDVREDEEWDAGHIDGAIHIPMGTVPQAVADGLDWLTPGAEVVVVCAVGGRSGQVAAWLNRQGYEALNLTGGMHAWADAGHPMVSTDGSKPTVL